MVYSSIDSGPVNNLVSVNVALHNTPKRTYRGEVKTDVPLEDSFQNLALQVTTSLDVVYGIWIQTYAVHCVALFTCNGYDLMVLLV